MINAYGRINPLLRAKIISPSQHKAITVMELEYDPIIKNIIAIIRSPMLVFTKYSHLKEFFTAFYRKLQLLLVVTNKYFTWLAPFIDKRINISRIASPWPHVN